MENNLEKGVEKTVPPAVDNNAKIIAERLKEMRQKDRTELAKAMGFESWDAALNSGVDKKLLDAGIEPSMGKPVIDELVAQHPDVVKAREVLAEAQKSKRDSDLKVLNTKFGTNIESFDALDDEVKSLVNKGLSIDQAYVAVHYNEISIPKVDPITLAKTTREISLQHLTATPGTGNKELDIQVSQADIDNVRRFIPNATLDQIKEFKSKNNL